MQRRPSVVWPLARTPHHESGRELVPGTDCKRINPKASGSRRLANPAALFLRFTQVLQPGKIPIERKKILRFFQLSV